MHSQRRAIDALAYALVYGALMPCSVPIAAAQDVGGQPDAADERIKVFVTGSNIPTLDRETAVPVQIITREEIQRANIQTAAELAHTISANVSYGNFTENQALAGSLSPDWRRPRCADSRRNGRSSWSTDDESRTTRFAGTVTDLNVIPVAAIERVEVLKDGASAIYGSDAIGGVINFILLDEFRGAAGDRAVQLAATHRRMERPLQRDGGLRQPGRAEVQRVRDGRLPEVRSSRPRAIGAPPVPTTSPAHFNRTSPNSFPANVLVRIHCLLRNPTGDPANGYQNPSCAPPDLLFNAGHAGVPEFSKSLQLRSCLLPEQRQRE